MRILYAMGLKEIRSFLFRVPVALPKRLPFRPQISFVSPVCTFFFQLAKYHSPSSISLPQYMFFSSSEGMADRSTLNSGL